MIQIAAATDETWRTLLGACEWHDIACFLFSVCAVVWLAQQLVHDSIRKEVTGVLCSLLRSVAWGVSTAVVLYVAYSCVDWSHVSKSTARAGLRAFAESIFGHVSARQQAQ